jgi:hypothetical protein
MSDGFEFISRHAGNFPGAEYLACVDRFCRSPEGQGLFWFGRSDLLDRQATLVLTNHVEAPSPFCRRPPSDDGRERLALYSRRGRRA